ncbi:MAG: LLM class flavin-dependent oxidoreductase [Burkholderiales bacterium]|nr:LLM class flavin-dependent oxidoreductase [Burkholderiales bacterium]
MNSSRPIRLNAFAMNCVGHQAPGLWTHPRDQSWRYQDPDYWIELARILERGLFDGLFLADVLGVYDVFGESPAAALRNAAQIPVNDPLMLVPLMAGATRHLGFGVTCSVSYEHPYPFARRMSTLDHLTRGRIGWNIVTSYLDSAARNMGLDRQVGHDDRYEFAEEYLEVCYKLWEGSWKSGAVRRDKTAGIFADPAKVHAIGHEGPAFRVPGIHLCEPSPQRTPVLYQAGASRRGKAFAGKHAECVFVAAPSQKILRQYVHDIRQSATEQGRDPSQILIFAMFTIVVDETEDAARRKLADFRSHVSVEAALTLLSGWTGIDFAPYRPDDVVRYIENDAGRSFLESFTTADPDRLWTVREVAEWVGIGGRGPVAVGTPAQVADMMEDWIDQTGLDGFNLTYVLAHETFESIVDLVVPELQRRGRYKTSYSDGTLREKLFGGNARLGETHPAVRAGAAVRG